MSGDEGPPEGESASAVDADIDVNATVDVDALLSGIGFDPETNVLTRRQAEVYVLRERGLRQADVAEALGTSRPNVASIEASARENVEKARNAVAFADVLAAPVRIDIEPGTDLIDVTRRVFRTCDDAGIEVDHTAPGLMEMVSDTAGEAVRGREVVDAISLGVTTDGTVHVASR